MKISIILFCLLMFFSSCRPRTEFEIYHITIVNGQGVVLFDKEGRLDYYQSVKTFNGEAYVDIHVVDQTNYRNIYRISGVGLQIIKEYLGLKPNKDN